MAKEKSTNWFARHKVLTVILALVVIGIISSAAGGGNTTSNSNNKSGTEQKSEEKTKFDIAAFYEKVQNGMSKDEVTNLANKKVGSCTESETQGFGKYEICSWYGDFGDSAFATVTFKDGVVDSKTKTGF